MKTELYYQDDVSDKVYIVEMEEQGEGYVVNISYGRRGANLQTGTKTVLPVTKDEAQKIFDKVVKEKVAKGYVQSNGQGVVAKVTQVQAVIGYMLCKKATKEEAKELVKSGNWIIETKHDGVRASIRDGKLYCRRGNDITKRFPEFEGIEKIEGIFDGEVVAQSGIFSEVSGRMHLKDKLLMKLASKKNPAKLMVFEKVSDKIVEERHQDAQNANLPAWCEVVEQTEDFEVAWKEIEDKQLEGVVLKRKGSIYQPGKRSDWLKVKAWEEVEAVFTKYEEHPKGITIETSDGRRVVVNGAQSVEVKNCIDTYGCVRAEIQHLPQVNSSEWRFPSFRGIVK